MKLGICCPAKPEEADREEAAADEHWWQASFGCSAPVVLCDGFAVIGLVAEVDAYCDEDADE